MLVHIEWVVLGSMHNCAVQMHGQLQETQSQTSLHKTRHEDPGQTQIAVTGDLWLALANRNPVLLAPASPAVVGQVLSVSVRTCACVMCCLGGDTSSRCP